MLENARPQGIPKPPVALVIAIAAAACLAGGTLVFFEQEISFAIMMQLLNPGRNTVSAVAERAGSIYRFRFDLFHAGSLFIAIPLAAAWLASTGYRQYARTAVLLFVSSVLVSGAVFWLYRQYMQVQLTDLRLWGQLVPPRSRGSMTPLGDVPFVLLTLSGPLLASAFVLMRRRRIGQTQAGVRDSIR
ncbi:hypothetical protein [Polaromonas sp. YR568]|uniref:hypothetical protein n=1 Tax=Polaromonas sp. YR568 TaxID=1855301 RepID=UPI00398C0BD9